MVTGSGCADIRLRRSSKTLKIPIFLKCLESVLLVVYDRCVCSLSAALYVYIV